jgi:hypothetical protein
MSPQPNRTAAGAVTGFDSLEFAALAKNFIEVYANRYYHFNYLFFEAAKATSNFGGGIQLPPHFLFKIKKPPCNKMAHLI